VIPNQDVRTTDAARDGLCNTTVSVLVSIILKVAFNAISCLTNVQKQVRAEIVGYLYTKLPIERNPKSQLQIVLLPLFLLLKKLLVPSSAMYSRIDGYIIVCISAFIWMAFRGDAVAN